MMDSKPSETCRVLFQNKSEKLVHLVGFYYKDISQYYGTDNNDRLTKKKLY